jgi:hypothetical protein
MIPKIQHRHVAHFFDYSSRVIGYEGKPWERGHLALGT